MIAQVETKTYTAEEYLEAEVNSVDRHEFINGEIILMAGGSPDHNEIALNLGGALKLALKGKPYRTFSSDQRLWVPQLNNYTYPDLIVAAKPIELQSGRTDTITNPLLIAEVLSKGTRAYDRDDKFAAYRSIPSFQEYLLIDQYRVQVQQYSKTDANKWIFSEYSCAGDRLMLTSVQVEISVADLYENIEFSE
ncbi:MAG: Uma2 family endonuclease [Microcoleus sp. PH2017_29_MFU_D_A]|uniref:Uma2 family endonuclease n=1 Tax=unclassified Microcoleus TaxID=2642155 RepID=UPI001D3BA645|nr:MULTISPECIES: Uma2 family endonuclease [unclassified Microcoleus]MCC3421355.1 Uma2 family endonuclease [Microcoleus sp. PH2017_07_MST_O_A]TAE53093.1 MAG: Uma2 family endonuclease [Oscillatoriales cyanobacterium]MCC3425041.1 Uma2 family endonuclease [Microcoleus sp. PH2017_01_SCD_O_A]MCC3455188.1 Uma2 family endonuclease [Microcoleus sp. PH2017_08_TRC_O_A]MCC3607673.1 Uma2 family endonuclease [Microcoleus sp. PH2017_29_MFU_D_A]